MVLLNLCKRPVIFFFLLPPHKEPFPLVYGKSCCSGSRIVVRKLLDNDKCTKNHTDQRNTVTIMTISNMAKKKKKEEKDDDNDDGKKGQKQKCNIVLH